MKKLLLAVNLSATLLLAVGAAAHSSDRAHVAENGGDRVIQQQMKRLSDRDDSISVAEGGGDRVLQKSRQRALVRAEGLELAADGAERSLSLRRV